LKAASSSIPRESVSSRNRLDVTGDGCAVLPDPWSGPFIYKKKIKWKRDKKHGGIKPGMSFDL